MGQRIAMVTGAGSGIGRASAMALMQAGYAVVLVGAGLSSSRPPPRPARPRAGGAWPSPPT